VCRFYVISILNEVWEEECPGDGGRILEAFSNGWLRYICDEVNSADTRMFLVGLQKETKTPK
jgi:hypothetical protein